MNHFLFCMCTALALAGCAGSRAQPSTDQQAAADKANNTANARAMGRMTVKGGEQVELGDARLLVMQVSYLESPCPAGAKCIHSGHIRSVRVVVQQGSTQEERVIVEGAEAVIQSVLVRVLKVREGPEADIEVQLPLVD